MKRALLLPITALALALLPAVRASAHPLGNFTINQYSGISIYADTVVVDLVTDEAELPTVQARGDMDTDHDGAIADTEATAWASKACASAADQTTLTLDGRRLAVHADARHSLTFPPGQAGLPTLRLECTLRASARIAAGRHGLAYRNLAFDGRIGWHEVVIATSGVNLVASDVATTSATDRLTHYPVDQSRSSPDQRAATVTFEPAKLAAPAPAVAATPGAAATALLPRSADRASRAFTDLVARRHLTLAFGILATLIAIVLGAFHALAPGHGKTVIAAYVVGQRGTLRQAGFIGLTVTATHTAGVAVLGLVLTTSSVIAPERLYPWLGLVSGLLLAGIGVTLARRALQLTRMRRALAPRVAPVRAPVAVGAPHTEAHDDDVHHDHGDHDHSDGHDHDHHQHGSGEHSHGGWTHSHAAIDPALGWRSLVAVGFAGGLVPSPSALLVLLGAIALGRTWFGLVLVVAYGAGMAATLAAAGLLLVRARGWFERRAPQSARSRRALQLTRVLPLATSSVIIVVGLSLAVRAGLKI